MMWYNIVQMIKRSSVLKKQYIQPDVDFVYYSTDDVLNGSKAGDNNTKRIDDFEDFDPNAWENVF